MEIQYYVIQHKYYTSLFWSKYTGWTHRALDDSYTRERARITALERR